MATYKVQTGLETIEANTPQEAYEKFLDPRNTHDGELVLIVEEAETGKLHEFMLVSIQEGQL
jgi:hypothetical protein